MEKLIDNDGLHAVIETSIHLSNGRHRVTVESFENSGWKELRIQFCCQQPEYAKAGYFFGYGIL